MHFCDDSAKDISKAKDSAGAAYDNIQEIVDKYYDCQQNLQGRSDDKQGAFSKIGATFASDYMQAAKVRAGELKRLLEKCARLKEEHDELIKDPSPDFSAIAKQEYLEGQVINLQEFANRAQAFFDDAEPEFLKSCVQEVKPSYNIKDEYRVIQYYGEHRDTGYEMSICGGDMIGKPLFLDETECGARCRDTIGCEAFNSFGVAGATPPGPPLKKKKSKKGGFMQRGRKSNSDATGGTCASFCGSKANQGGCFCDSTCQAAGDCCADYSNVCQKKSGVCVLLKNAKQGKLYTADECDNYTSQKALTQCFYRLSDSKGLEIEYDEERQWCK